MKLGEINRQATELFNGLPDEDRKKAGLGYSLAQHTTIVQLRTKNKEAYQNYDRKLAEWQKNIEQSILREYLSTSNKLKERQTNDQL